MSQLFITKKPKNHMNEASQSSGALVAVRVAHEHGIINILTEIILYVFLLFKVSLASIVSFATSPVAIGLFTGCIGFMFMWPKTRTEGFCRIFVGGLFSHLFGKPLLSAVVHYLPWVKREEIETAIFFIAAIPGWFLLGTVFLYFKRNKSTDIGQLVSGVFDAIKRVKK